MTKPTTRATRTQATQARRPSGSLPSLDLLNPAPRPDSTRKDSTDRHLRKIHNLFTATGIKVRQAGVESGPVLHRYTLLLEGQPVSARGLEELSLRAASALRVRGVRITGEEAEHYMDALRGTGLLAKTATPDPGQVIRVEVPHADGNPVNLRAVLGHDAYARKTQVMALPVALGLDVAGGPIVLDLARGPHLMLGGGPGSGKTSCLRSLVLGLLMAHGPDSLRLMLATTRESEMASFRGLPHLLAPIAAGTRDRRRLLVQACAEMDRRYRLFKSHAVRDLRAFNALTTPLTRATPGGETDGGQPLFPMPRIVIIVDGLGSPSPPTSLCIMKVLMKDKGRPYQHRGATLVCIMELLLKGRAAGMYLVLSGQVLDSSFRSLHPYVHRRMTFRTDSQDESLILLHEPGAELLDRPGDFLLGQPGFSSAALRGQGVRVSEGEMKRVAGWHSCNLQSAGIVFPPDGTPSVSVP